ncbi:Rieske domain-containing protein [Cytospora mali]|uniref:Rieske domain-containing protein n=1 Tax=Cytospora mali TaxID=578113 RepID=A0A194VUP6_CYTMA|nr:Rieske domain-containing protein [Valsa mali]
MASFFNPFSRSKGGDAWFHVGLTSSFPNITAEDGESIAHMRPCGNDNAESPGCKVFYVPKEDSTRASEVTLDDSGAPPEAGGLRDQVLVFQYKETFHAINHECPHSSYPLSNGAPFDIEDFGIVWSSGVTCPKHGWSFDLSSGKGDRGTFKLQVWEVQLRPVAGSAAKSGEEGEQEEKEVWVRRKQRMG